MKIMVIGDQFPQNTRLEAVRRGIYPGSVLYLYCPFTHPPKDKFLLVACVEPILNLFVINSEIPDFVQKRPHLKRCQVKMDVASHPFLTHDSYIDCKDAIISITREHAEEQIYNEMNRLKGNIKEPVKEKVIAAIKSCEKLKPQNVTWILAAFENLMLIKEL
jgi:hypothetical protein